MFGAKVCNWGLGIVAPKKDLEEIQNVIPTEIELKKKLKKNSKRIGKKMKKNSKRIEKNEKKMKKEEKRRKKEKGK